MISATVPSFFLNKYSDPQKQKNKFMSTVHVSCIQFHSISSIFFFNILTDR